MTEEEILNLINTNETFAESSLPDKKFTLNDLDSLQRLYVPDVLPGSISVIDASGKMVLADQIERLDSQGVCIGVYVDASDFNMQNGDVWKIRYARGIRGEQGQGVQNASTPEANQDVVMYALLFN